jgi:D-alanyl-D-alanine carboxypeptidase (penicillin-binding protein 5/6)
VLKISPDLNLRLGDQVKASDIFNAMLIGSNNDAAVTLADFTSRTTGENFVDMMNHEAESLSMINTHFANPMGFDSPNNYSTAEDLKILISQVENLSSFTSLGRETSYKFTSDDGVNYKTVSTNKLLASHPDIEAIKTGYTEQAQGAMATKFNLGTRQVVILVLDSQNREGDTLTLKQQIETNFQPADSIGS